MSASREKMLREGFGKHGLMRTIGAEIISAHKGRVDVRFGFNSALTQQNGFIHAGVVTSVMDTACGYAAFSVGSNSSDVLSVEFKVNFLAPAVGESFVVHAEVKRAGKVLSVCTADAFAVHDGKEKLIATMLATMMNMPAQPA